VKRGGGIVKGLEGKGCRPHRERKRKKIADWRFDEKKVFQQLLLGEKKETPLLLGEREPKGWEKKDRGDRRSASLKKKDAALPIRKGKAGRHLAQKNSRSRREEKCVVEREEGVCRSLLFEKKGGYGLREGGD